MAVVRRVSHGFGRSMALLHRYSRTGMKCERLRVQGFCGELLLSAPHVQELKA